MFASWKKDKKDLKLDQNQLILKELVKFFHMGEQGPYRVVGAEQQISLLSLLISFHKEIPVSSYHEIVSNSISATIRKGPITEDELIEEINEQSKSFLQKARKPYVIATSLSIAYGTFRWREFAKRHRINGSTISLIRELPSKFDWDSVMNEAEGFREHTQPVDYTFVTIRVEARTMHEAVDVAFDNLDLLRGIWNYLLNRRHRDGWLVGVRTPKNKILKGPYSKLYSLQPFSQTDGLWSGDSFSTPAPLPVNLSNSWQGLIERERRLRSRLRKNPLRARVEQWIRDYGRALDLHDYNLAYLALWRIIEQMVGLDRNDNHSEIAKRVSFLFPNTDYHKLVLNLLRDLRNNAVHSGEEISRAEDTLDELRGYAESLLQFYIDNPFQFTNISDFADFLRLSPDANHLEKELQLRQYANDFRRDNPRKGSAR